MANGKYFIQPGGDLGPGLQGFTNIISQIPAIKTQKAKANLLNYEQQKAQIADAVFSAIANPNKIMQLSDALDMPSLARDYQADPVAAEKKLHKLAASLDPKRYKMFAEGLGIGDAGYASKPIATFEHHIAGSGIEGTPEEIQAHKVALGLEPKAQVSPEYYRKVEFNRSFGELDARIKNEPKLEAAVTRVKSVVKQEMDDFQERKRKSVLWKSYDAAMSELSEALTHTKSGPFMGRILALTSDAQTADAAVAVMAPILKEIFRQPGEGIFSDRDQELLLAMMADRKLRPAARTRVIRAVDRVIRAKLRVPDEVATGKRYLSEGELDKKLTDAEQKTYDAYVKEKELELKRVFEEAINESPEVKRLIDAEKKAADKVWFMNFLQQRLDAINEQKAQQGE